MSEFNLLEHLDMPSTEPQPLLQEALTVMIAHHSDVKDGRVLRLARSGVVTWATTDNDPADNSFISFDTIPLHQDAFEKNTAIHQGDTIVTPLQVHDEPIALLELTLSSTTMPADTIPIVSIVKQLSVLLTSSYINHLFQQQMAATEKINECHTFEDVAEALGRQILAPHQFIAILPFEFDDTGNLMGMHTLTTANRERAYSGTEPIDINLDYLNNVYQTLQSDSDVLISDPRSDDRLTDSNRQWLETQKIQSLYLLPLVTENDLQGLIAVVDTRRPLVINQLERQLYRTLAKQASRLVEQRRLLETTQDAVRESGTQVEILHNLNQLMTTANKSQDEQLLLDEAAKLVVQTTDADHVGIVLTRQTNRDAGYVASEYPEMGIIGHSIPTGAGSIIGRMREQKQVIRLHDLLNDDNLNEHDREILHQAQADDSFFVPMFDLNDELLGSIGVDYHRSDVDISEETLDLAETIASQIAINLQKLRLLQDSQRRATQMQQVANFSQAVQANLQTDAILREAIESSKEILDLDYIRILLHHRSTDQLLEAATLLDEAVTVPSQRAPVTPDDDSVAYEVWETRETIHIDNIQANWEWTHPLSSTLRTLLAAPLLAGGVTMGIVEIGNMQPNAYEPPDIAAFRQLANQIAVALTNATAYAQSQKLARNKSIANDIITSLQQQTSVENILRATAQELGKAIGARRARIRLSSDMPAERKKKDTR